MKSTTRLIIAILIAILIAPALSLTSGQTAAPLEPDDTYKVYLPLAMTPVERNWPMVAGNPQRTSWTPEEVKGYLSIDWYRPIEAYISQNVQIIASNGLLYISTARGLYALDAASGDVAWRFDTQLPIGNSPTVDDGVVYVGGYDRKIHALNALTGIHLWSFDGAEAGFSTNPLVVSGKVLAGNRDGYFYAVGAHGSPQQGQLIWKYKTDGMIDLSAAYKSGVVYFASNDNHAYALRVETGALVWKSGVLPGDGYHSYWPVIYKDTVIFSAASGYRNGIEPGTASLNDATSTPYGRIFDMERDDLFAGQPDGALIGNTFAGSDWASGETVVDMSRLLEYLEDNPNAHPNLHKPWRRVVVGLNISDGSEFTLDTDGDGYREYIPAAMMGTQSGNRYPPIVGSDQILYLSNIYQRHYIPQGRVMGWNMESPFMSVTAGRGAVDEPQAISAGGSTIYRSICCDRVGDLFSMNPPHQTGAVWTYNSPLSSLAPGYDQMWWGVEPGDPVRLHGNYGTENGVYHNHGDQNPIIPYQGRLYIHRSNVIFAFGTSASSGELPLLQVNSVQDPNPSITQGDLIARLESEIQEIIAAGHLRPGYYNAGQFSRFAHLADYFENPGETLYTLSKAYPYLSPSLQQQTKAYLINEFDTYFNPAMYSDIGWAEGVARENVPIPDDILSALANNPKNKVNEPRYTWLYPQHNFYSMWLYAQIVPEDAVTAYNLAKNHLHVPVPPQATDEWFIERPFEQNAYIAGYIGFLNLQELAGAAEQDSQLRSQVDSELNRLLQLRSSTFSKDTYWFEENCSYHLRTLNIARNFIFLVPELADYLNQTVYAGVQDALDEYNWIAPYWFAARYNGVVNEGVRQNLYDYNALFQAKAYIMKEPKQELIKYLDVPGFLTGDLLYIQNLIAAIEAP